MIPSIAHAEQCMADWDLLLTDARVATMRDGDVAYGAIEDGAVAFSEGTIAWVGPQSELPNNSAGETRSLSRQWITPALIDCHTHLVFGGDRATEFERRLLGASYEDIALSGGGIMSTVRATRAESHDQLFESALQRARALVFDGVATIEIKSGYGLDIDNEIKMLEVARRIGDETELTIKTTLLAAHTIPTEFDNNAEGYIDFICEQLLPVVAERGLADAVDAYCESIAFTPEQVARVFTRAQELGLPIKLHADQLSDFGGAELAAKFDALSADHLEHASASGIRALSQAGTIAVLLPGAFVTLNQEQVPPIDEMRAHNVSIAVATDCNPGTSPLTSVRESMALASRVFGLTPEESLAGTTRVAARALGLGEDRGTLEIGKRADVAVWNVEHPRDLSYWLGTQPLSSLFIAGRDASLT
jgi:imidazolonepropionase